MKLKKSGFSLTEVLMAVGILSVGMMLIATMFPVAIYLTSVASERTMAAIIADEAFAKIQMYKFGGSLPSGPDDYEKTLGSAINASEFTYNPAGALANPQYYWSAVYKQLPAAGEYQMTVFVSRKTNAGLMYPDPLGAPVPTPRPISIPVICNSGGNQMTFTNTAEAMYVNPPAAIIDNATGKIYRVIDRGGTVANPVVTIDRISEDTISSIWLIPPPVTGGRNADIEVYQRIIRF